MWRRATAWRSHGSAAGATARSTCRAAPTPRGHLADIAAALRDGGYDALLPTHELAWLFAAGRHLLPADAPLAVADIEAFDQVQGTHIVVQTFTTTPRRL